MYLAIGIITLFLTAFTIAYYSYLFRNTDHDVSFFISVGFISFVMNLFTNASESACVLSILYLIIAVAFIALGWAVDVDGSIGFYTSIGPWCKATFTETAVIGWKLLSFLIAPAGIVLYFVYYKSNNELARTCGKAGLWGLLLWIILLWAILGIVL